MFRVHHEGHEFAPHHPVAGHRQRMTKVAPYATSQVTVKSIKVVRERYGTNRRCQRFPHSEQLLLQVADDHHAKFTAPTQTSAVKRLRLQ